MSKVVFSANGKNAMVNSTKWKEVLSLFNHILKMEGVNKKEIDYNLQCMWLHLENQVFDDKKGRNVVDYVLRNGHGIAVFKFGNSFVFRRYSSQYERANLYKNTKSTGYFKYGVSSEGVKVEQELFRDNHMATEKDWNKEA